jgi:hypothetical protein
MRCYLGAFGHVERLLSSYFWLLFTSLRRSGVGSHASGRGAPQASIALF